MSQNTKNEIETLVALQEHLRDVHESERKEFNEISHIYDKIIDKCKKIEGMVDNYIENMLLKK